MKSPWVWIVIVLIALYLFAGESNNPAPQHRTEQYQPLPQTPLYLPESTSKPSHRTPKSFLGYECTDDCSGHEAGYEWAEENDIDDPDDCDGNSESFIEGGRAYAEEQMEQLKDDQ